MNLINKNSYVQLLHCKFKIMKYIFFLIILIVFISKCKNKNDREKPENNSFKTICINPTNKESIRLSKVFSSLSYVKLSSKESHIVGIIKKLVIFENKIFILDNNNKIFIFDHTGNFINKIDEHGRGTEEYEVIYDFNIDRYDRQIKFTAVLLNKMLCFDLDGNFVRERRITNVIYRTKVLIGKDYYIIWANNTSNNETGINVNNDIIFVTKKWDYISSLLPIKKWEQDFKFDTPNAFSVYDEKISFLKPLNDTIYYIKPDSITPRFIVDFGKYKIPKDLFENVTNKTYYEKIQIQRKFIKKVTDGNFAYFVKNFRENEHSIFFMFSYNMKQMNTFYSKLTEGIFITKNLFNDIDHGIYTPPIAATDSEFISIIEPADLIEHYKTIKNKYPKDELKTIKQLVDSITEFDNPILVFAKTKPF